MKNSTTDNLEKIRMANEKCLHLFPGLFERKGELHCIDCNQIKLSIESKTLSDLEISYQPERIKIMRPFPNKSYFMATGEYDEQGLLLALPPDLQGFDVTFHWSILLHPYCDIKRLYHIAHRCRMEFVQYNFQGEACYSTEEIIARGFPRRCLTPFSEAEFEVIKNSRVEALWKDHVTYQEGVKTLIIEETVLLPKLSREEAKGYIEDDRNLPRTRRACRCPEKKMLLSKRHAQKISL